MSLRNGQVNRDAASSDYIQIKKNNVLTIEETSGLAITKVVRHVTQGATKIVKPQLTF